MGETVQDNLQRSFTEPIKTLSRDQILPIPVGNGGRRLKAGVLQSSVVLTLLIGSTLRTTVERVTP